MNQQKTHEFITEKVTNLKGVGNKIKNLLKKKKIEKISDLLWNFPIGYTDRSNLVTLDKLVIGKITTIMVKVIKYNFPRIRNLPNKIICSDDKGEIDIVFFNSREGYIRKILPLNSWVVISGKINYFKKKYQITNPAYVVPANKQDYVNKVIAKYPLTEGLTEKVYRKLIDSVISKIPDLSEWHDQKILDKIGNISWKDAIIELHKKNDNILDSDFFRRLAYDEILANLLVLSKIRRRIKKTKKKPKIFDDLLSQKIINNFNFNLTDNQINIIKEINYDLKSDYKMFRLLQGDVGSGKTIIALISAANIIKSNFQVALMAPTEILAKQHFNLAKNVFIPTTPNPTSGFLLMFPKEEVIYLDLSFEEASRFIVSAGTSNTS